MRWPVAGLWVLLALPCASCRRAAVAPDAGGSTLSTTVDAESATIEAGRGGLASTTTRARESPSDASTDPMNGHRTTKLELLGLVLSQGLDAGRLVDTARLALDVVPGRFNQGNKAMAKHTVSERTCLDGLAGLTLQTPEQRTACHGAASMVPIYRGGDVKNARTCIDLFEYPNHACVLPFVWGSPTEAESLCRAEGKRLCTQAEWTLACAGDPNGGSDRDYAYGDALDLDACNTKKPHAFGPDGETWSCSARTAETAWNTCATETEPAGAFPACRSRFGVFDLHGNVAEMMTRLGPDGEVLTQLKGSAFFYVDVAREKGAAQKPGGRETYPDHCAYDPRWHVEPLREAKHSNYHLGFRCCLAL